MIRLKILLLLLLLLSVLLSCEDQVQHQEEKPRANLAYQIFRKSTKEEDIKKKLSLLTKALAEIDDPADSLRSMIYDHKIYYLHRLDQLDSALYYSDLMIADGIKRRDTLEQARAFYRKARTFFYKGNHAEVLQNSFQSQKYYLLAGDSTNAARRLVELAIAQIRLGDLSGSQESATKALSILEKNRDSTYLTSAHNNLAMTFKRLHDPGEAVAEYYKALKYSRSKEADLEILNNIAVLYAEQKEFEKSLSLFDSIRPLAAPGAALYQIKDNLYITQWLASGVDVEDSLKQVLHLRRQTEGSPGLLSSVEHLARVNKEQHPQEALKYATAYYELAQEKSVRDELNALEYLIELAPAPKSRDYAVIYINLNDSLVHSMEKAKNLFAKIKYDEEQKLQHISRLKALSARQHINLLNQRNQRNIAVLGILLLGGLTGFFYYFLLQRHKYEKVREIHQTEARISKRIHDELANDVYNVMTELENPQNLNKEITLNKLEDIYTRTRNISRENRPVATGPDYADDLHYMLSHNTPQTVKLYLAGLQNISWNKYKDETKMVIYRVLQELMVNMKKHSAASLVSLSFQENSSKLLISYRDNGKGLSKGALRKGSGLSNMNNRIKSIGGSSAIVEEENGFSMEITLPV